MESPLQFKLELSYVLQTYKESGGKESSGGIRLPLPHCLQGQLDLQRSILENHAISPLL